MKTFVPLECNPTVFNEFLGELGVKDCEFTDVWSLDPEILVFLPRPVLALLMVFPISEAYEKYRLKSDAEIEDAMAEDIPDAQCVWYKQTIKNSCGTMALLHAIANCLDASHFEEGGLAQRILKDTIPMSVADRVKFLENNKELEHIHSKMAGEGDTVQPAAEDEVELHYVCLAKSKDGQLVELDGRRKGPVYHGKLDADLLDENSIDVVKGFMQREEGSHSFSIIALIESS